MGANIETGMMEMMDADTMDALLKEKSAFSDKFHNSLDKMLPGDMHEEMRERRHDEGPPIFRVGEVLELRGARFEVKLMNEDALVLMPVKG